MVVSIRLSSSQERLLSHLAKQKAKSRSDLVRNAIDQFCRQELAKPPDNAFLAIQRWVGCARSGKQDLSSRSHHHYRSALNAKSRPR